MRGPPPTAAPADRDHHFVASLRALFDTLDTQRSGLISLAQIAAKWRQMPASSCQLPPAHLIDCLRRVAPENGLLTFDHFLAGIRHHSIVSAERSHHSQRCAPLPANNNANDYAPHPAAPLTVSSRGRPLAKGVKARDSILRRARSEGRLLILPSVAEPPAGSSRQPPPSMGVLAAAVASSVGRTGPSGAGVSGRDRVRLRRSSAQASRSQPSLRLDQIFSQDHHQQEQQHRRPFPETAVLKRNNPLEVARRHHQHNNNNNNNNNNGGDDGDEARRRRPASVSAAAASSTVFRHHRCSPPPSASASASPASSSFSSAAGGEQHRRSGGGGDANQSHSQRQRTQPPVTVVLRPKRVKSRRAPPPPFDFGSCSSGNLNNNNNNIYLGNDDDAGAPYHDRWYHQHHPPEQQQHDQQQRQRQRRRPLSAAAFSPAICRSSDSVVTSPPPRAANFSSSTAVSGFFPRLALRGTTTTISPQQQQQQQQGAARRLPTMRPAAEKGRERRRIGGQSDAATAGSAAAASGFSRRRSSYDDTSVSIPVSPFTSTGVGGSYPEEHLPQVEKHRRLLAEECDLVARGMETARALADWYAGRRESLDKRRRMLANGLVALDSSVHEQKLNFHRALITELNRRITALIASSERDFPLHGNLRIREQRRMTEQSPSPAASAKKVFGVGQKAFAQMTSPPTPSTTVSLSPPYTTSQSQSSSSDHGTDVGELQLLARLRSRNQVLVRELESKVRELNDGELGQSIVSQTRSNGNGPAAKQRPSLLDNNYWKNCLRMPPPSGSVPADTLL